MVDFLNQTVVYVLGSRSPSNSSTSPSKSALSTNLTTGISPMVFETRALVNSRHNLGGVGCLLFQLSCFHLEYFFDRTCVLWVVAIYYFFTSCNDWGHSTHSENDDPQNGLARHCSFCRVREEMFSYWWVFLVILWKIRDYKCIQG